MTTRIFLRRGGAYSTARFSSLFRKTTTTARNLRPNEHLCRRCFYASGSTSSPSSKDDENINEKQKKPKLLSFHPLSFSGAKLCANMSMLSYWNCGQKGFLDAKIDETAAESNTKNLMEVEGKFGFEFVISNEPEMLRQKALSLCVIEEKEREMRTWLDFDDDGNDDDEGSSGSSSSSSNNNKPESRTLIVSLKEPNWVLVVFRGTTPNPQRGFFRESKINSRAGQVVWKDCPYENIEAKVHAGYANAYAIVRERVERDVVERVKRKIRESEEEKEESKTMPPRIVVTGHSLGGAMATLCAARLGNSEEIKKLGAKVSLISFGQPRVGDANFKTLFEKKKENANNNEDNYCMDGYLRIVNEQDVFARVPPKSGIWIPEDVLETSLSSSIDAKQWTYQYEHAGDCVWYRDDGRILFREEPKGVSLRTVNPISIALDHSKYAKLFDDEGTKKNFPRAVCFHPERTDPKTICINCPDPKNDFRRRETKSI